jgi:hypothetical protein
MISLEFSFLRLLRRLQRRAASDRFVLMHLDQLDPLPRGPGWFDSSWELEHGLDVLENAELDADARTRLEDAMIAAALARLRQAAGRASKRRKLADTAVGADPAAPAAAPAPADNHSIAAPRGDNLIEFEPLALGDYQLPSRGAVKARTELPELELALA